MRVGVDEKSLPYLIVSGKPCETVVKQAAYQSVVDAAEVELSSGVELVLEADLFHSVIEHFLRRHDVIFKKAFVLAGKY